jgi:hypothetical protein
MPKNRKPKARKIREGNLIKVFPSSDIRIRMQDPELGHLDDVHLDGESIVGVVTKLWPSDCSIREIEIMSSGNFILLTTNNGVNDNIEVLSC